MSFNFELFLTLAVLLSGIIWLVDAILFAKKRQLADGKTPLFVDYARSFFPILLVVLLLRSFLAEPFRIPSGSDKPTLLVGDFILVNKFGYGLRLPVLHTKILSIGEPKEGDIAVLRYPPDPSIDYIKRIVGLPGDHISYINKVLYVNGKEAPQQFVGTAEDNNGSPPSWPVVIKDENLQGIQHKIYLNPAVPTQDFSVTVPKGEYFAMGDNRDNSSDSRYWGFVPEANLVGKAFMVWFSWDSDKNTVRWNRIGKIIH